MAIHQIESYGDEESGREGNGRPAKANVIHDPGHSSSLGEICSTIVHHVNRNLGWVGSGRRAAASESENESKRNSQVGRGRADVGE